MENQDMIGEEISRMLASDDNACNCDFCTGTKRWEDNWCGRCAEVQMKAPKWWENDDVCDACEDALTRETEEA